MSDTVQVVDWPHGLYPLIDLPQRGSISKIVIESGWWELDQIFKIYPGQLTVVTGTAGHGKSTFILNLLVKLAWAHGVGSFLYVPENENLILEQLRRIWPKDDASFEHFAGTQCFVQTAVRDRYDEGNQAHTIEWVLNRAYEAVRTAKVEIVLIDPWNELDRARPKDMLMSDYIGQCLMQIKDFCRTMNAAVIVVAHPTKAINENGGRIAGLADIEGSMNWFNKCDNGLIVVRDPEKNTARVLSRKVRQIGAGRLGECHFYVDPQTGIFTPMTGAVTP